MTGEKDSKAFFFLRHNNDIDHIVPIIHKFLSTEKTQAEIIIYTDRYFLDDERIKLLKKFDNANIVFINDLFKKTSLTYWFNKYYFKYTQNFDKLIKKHAFLRRRADNAIKHITNKIFKDTKNGFVAFDWTATYFVKQVVGISKKKNLKTISLPHGDRPFANFMETINSLDYSCLDIYKPYEMFDYVVVPNSLCSKRFEPHMKKDKIKVLGSPRYSKEWMQVCSKFIPSFELEESKNKVKIVFFLRNMGFPIYWEEVSRTIKLITQFPEVYLVVKHHPRNRQAKKMTKNLIKNYPEIKENLQKNLKFLYSKGNSSALVQWADLIIDLGTSATWEAIRYKKPVLMPEYLHANCSTVAHYIKESEIKCRDQLYDAIKEITKNKKVKNYDEEQHKKFIKEVLDVPDDKVLERYSKFLKSVLEEKR